MLSGGSIWSTSRPGSNSLRPFRKFSPGKDAFFSTIYLPHLHFVFRVASGFILFGRLTHPRMPDAVPVREVSGLPPASFRFHLAMAPLPLAMRLMLPLRSGLSPVRTHPC